MIQTSKQNWVPGQTVRVGFLSLVVLATIPTPGDGKPDAYVLARADKHYRFTPYFGLERITADEARFLIQEAVGFRGQQLVDAQERVELLRRAAVINARLMAL